MADSVGTFPLIAGFPVAAGGAPPAQPAIELAQLPPAGLALPATLAGVVLGRGDGTLLLRTEVGTLALKTLLALPPGSRVDLRVLPGQPPTVVLFHIEEPTPDGTPPSGDGAQAAPNSKSPTAAPPADERPTQLDLGTEIEATVLSPAPSNQIAGTPTPAGTRLILRVTLLPSFSPTTTQTASTETAFIGTVVSGVADRTTVATPIGTLQLDQRLSLPAGTTLAFVRIAALPPAAAPARVDTGTVLEATVLSPPSGDSSQALPVGTRLVLRIVPLPSPQTDARTAQATDTFVGAVVTGSSSETMVDTPIGTLALEKRLALPPGTLLGLQRLAATPPEAPVEAPLAQRDGWPALDEALVALSHAAPELATRLRGDLTPTSGIGLAGTLLFLMGALNNGAWPGPKTANTLDSTGHHELRARLEGDVAEFRSLADPPKGDWRVFVLPLFDGPTIRPVRLYLRRSARGDARPDDGTRFVLDVTMSRMGALQLDGLVRQQRFDLVLRSHRAITAEMRHDITAVFHNATSAAGLAGDIIFTTASRFAVAPLDALRAHVGVDA